MGTVRELNAFSDIKILSDARRLALIRLLMRRPATLTQLGQKLGMSAARVRHHLKVLEAEDMVERVSPGPNVGSKEKYYRASAKAFSISQIILPQSSKAGTVFVIGSHDLALDMLASRAMPGTHLPEIYAVPVGSLNGLIALYQGFCDMTGTHLYDPETGGYNIPHVRNLFPGRAMEVVTLAHREQGLLVAPGNPRQIRGVKDLARRDLAFAQRRSGSGTRVWLDWKIRSLGVGPLSAGKLRKEYNTHAEVAQAIHAGEADFGLAVAAAANTLELDFIPILEEPFELIFEKEKLDDPLIAQLIDVICSRRVRKQIADLPGYRTTGTGRRRDVT